MKKFFLSFLCLFAALSADEIFTQLQAPFNYIEVNSRWLVEDQDEGCVLLSDKEDEDAMGIIIQGKRLSKKVTVKDLLDECTKAKGKLGKVPTLEKSFSEIDKEATFDTPSLSQVCGLAAVKIHNRSEIYVTTIYTNGVREESIIQLRGVHYLIPVGNRIYLVGFETPVENFSSLIKHLEGEFLPNFLLRPKS